MGIWQETGLSIKLDYCNPSKEPVINNNTRTWIITTIVVKLLKTHIISEEKHIVYLIWGSRIFTRWGKGVQGENVVWKRVKKGVLVLMPIFDNYSIM